MPACIPSGLKAVSFRKPFVVSREQGTGNREQHLQRSTLELYPSGFYLEGP
ncbi:MAG: hypothetical protein AAGF83_19855 [Cyanobacteria bacterium P01_G01_bin.67]